MKNKFASTISKEEILEKPLISFKGKIHIIDTPEEAQIAIDDLKNHKILGFDTETRPSFKKGKKNKLALLQLSTDENAYLFRLFKYVPVKLTEILESVNILKIGAAIRDDLSGLQHYLKFIPGNFIDLQDFVKQFNIENNGLKKLAAIVLNSRISKSQQTSNWENELLTGSQQLYAATDAWICLEIYHKLNSIK